MAVQTAVMFGLAASSALVIGGIAGAYWGPPEELVGGALALSSGALITALAFELFEPAYHSSGPWLASGGLFAGAIAFTAIKWWLQRKYDDDGNSGAALLASVTLDGVPENLALGTALIGGSEGGLAILVAIFLSNLPEAVGGSKDMDDRGFSRLGAVAAWAGVGLLLAGAVVAGSTLFSRLGEAAVAVAQAFAGGAVLAGVAIEILPDAYDEGGPLVALATALGFVVTFLLK